MAKSIGDLHSKITANASQFVAEFSRADNAARRSATEIDKQVDKVSKSVKKKFSAGDIGKDMLRGFGIGSGFAAAQQAAELIVGYYERAAEAAKSMEASAKGQLDAVLQMVAARRTDAQNLAAMQGDEMRARLALEAFDSRDRTEFRMTAGPNGSMGVERVERSWTEAEKAKRGELVKEWQELAAKVQAASDKIAKDTAATADKAAEDSVAAGLQALKAKLDMDFRWATERRKFNAQMAKEEIEAQDEIEARALEVGASITRQATERVQMWNEIFAKADEERAEAQKRVADAAAEMNDRLSGSMADVLIGVESLSDAFKQLARDIAKAWIQKNITDSLAGSITGSAIWSGIKSFTGFGAPAADGGFRDGSQPYLVGEEGPEIFNPGRSGTIIPAGRTAAMASGGGNIVVHQTNNFQSGVTRQEVSGLLPRIVEASKAAVRDEIQRRGGVQRAFA